MITGENQANKGKVIKAYVEHGALNKNVRELLKKYKVELVSFPFENPNRRTSKSTRPSNLRVSDMHPRVSDVISISDTVGSELYPEIEKIIGKKNQNDCRHFDTAYKEKCDIFITPDYKDIVSKSDELKKLTGVKALDSRDTKSIEEYLKSL